MKLAPLNINRLPFAMVVAVPVNQKLDSFQTPINDPLVSRLPPGKAENPLKLVAPVLGRDQKVIDFSGPPAILLPPKKNTNLLNSSNDGKCHPVGQIP